MPSQPLTATRSTQSVVFVLGTKPFDVRTEKFVPGTGCGLVRRVQQCR